MTTNLYCQIKPKFNPNKEYKTVNLSFETLAKRVSYMKANMDIFCVNGNDYKNLFDRIYMNEQLCSIDKKFSNSNGIFTLKMTNNLVFVFLFSNLCNLKGEDTGEVNVTFFKYTFGDADKNSIQNLIIKKKRLFINDNIYTEEMIFGKLVFIIRHDSMGYTWVKFKGKNIVMQRQALERKKI